MTNSNDYLAGWTKFIVNPKTGKTCYGGAARNVRLKQAQGIENLRTEAFLEGVAHLKPLIDQYQAQLNQNDQVLKQVLMELTSKEKASTK